MQLPNNVALWPKAEVCPPAANGKQQTFNQPIDIFKDHSSATQSSVVLTRDGYPHPRQDNQRRRADRLQTGHGHSWRNPEFAKDMAPSTAQTLVAMMHTTPAGAAKGWLWIEESGRKWQSYFGLFR